MVRLTVDPQRVLRRCVLNWQTSICIGTCADSPRAYQMLDPGEVPLAAKKKLWVQLVDTSTHLGYCFANRIDVLK